MPRISQMRCFLQSLSFQKVIGQLTQFIVIGWTPQWCVHLHTNVMTLTIIASFSFQVSFIRIEPERGTELRDKHSDEARMYLHTSRG